MSYTMKFAKEFIHLFQTGAGTSISWMTGVVSAVLMLMAAMSILIAFLGRERVTEIARLSVKNPVTRYLVPPFLSAFMSGSPISFTMTRFLPEYYKPSYCVARAQFCRTDSGIFPHINPDELFTWLGVAQGIDTLGLNLIDLAVRYMLVGILVNFIGGWVTDFTTAYVCKQQEITLSKTVEIAMDQKGIR